MQEAVYRVYLFSARLSWFLVFTAVPKFHPGGFESYMKVFDFGFTVVTRNLGNAIINQLTAVVGYL